MSSAKVGRSEQVNSLAKGLAVLTTFGQSRVPMTISEVSAATAAPKVLDLGYGYLVSTPLWQIVQPVLERISGEFKVSCSASVLDGTDILYVVRAPYRRVGHALVSAGSRQAVQVTAMGRVLLSGLAPEKLDDLIGRIQFKQFTERSICDPDYLREIVAEVRRQNYALVDQELEFGLLAIAVPLRNKQGEIVAAINAATSTWMADLDYLREKVLPAMFEGAEEVRANLPA
jgi:IclR family pca regulon transcriptional regulator